MATLMRRQVPLWVIEVFPTVLGCALIMGAFTFGLDSNPLAFMGLALAAIITLGCRDLALFCHWRRTRRARMKRVAERLQFTFREIAQENVCGWPELFRLGNNQTERKFTNVMEAPVGQTRVVILDFECDKPNSEGPASRQTVFAVRSVDIDHPHVALIPARWMDQLFGAFRERSAATVRVPNGYRLIDNCGAVETLGWRLSGLLDGKTTVEAGEGVLLVYRKDKLAQPDQIEELMRQGLEIYSAWCDMTLAGSSAFDD
jgi:hypothetical protein